jgi:hypothetical protein
MRLFGIILAVVVLSGCVVEMVKKDKPRKGPVPEVGYVDVGGGDVRYSSEGWGFVVSLRHATAMRRIRSTCGKLKFKIDDEFTHDDVDASYISEDLATNIEKGLNHYAVAPYHHIVFECVP